MVVLLLAMSLMAGADPVADMVEHAQTKLAISDCGDNARCTPVEDFRVSGDEEAGTDAKDRAFADDGTYCGVLGDKQCLSRPRLRLHASLPGQGSGQSGLGRIEMSPILPQH